MQHETLTAEWLLSLPEPQRAAILNALTDTEKAALRYNWPFWARPNQCEPEGKRWNTWLILAGRGSGKTRAGSEWVRKAKDWHSRIALVGETAADVRDVIIMGESGILETSPPWDRPTFNASRREIRWANGAIAKTYSAEEPDQLRGPQHEIAWLDELAKFKDPNAVWSNLQLGLRLGKWPRVLVTTTPRPIPIIRELLRQSQINPDATHVTRGSTFDNAKFLPAEFIESIKAKYEGTRLGRQELHAELLDDLIGALWSRDMIENARLVQGAPLRDMERVVVGVDPSGFDGETGDEQRIIVAGKEKGKDGMYVVLDDCSVKMRPEGWGRRVIEAYRNHKADRIVAEANYGGAMVRSVIQSVMPDVPVSMVTATRGKSLRAEPIASLYEQGKVKHVRPFPELEDQLCMLTTQGWEGTGSPDRADALVWALTELSTGNRFQIIGIIG
jgi:predicted phage terminase large subunit-like protein